MRCLLNIAIFSFAILLRILVGFHPHSGQDDYQGAASNYNSHNDNNAAKPTKYGGDYEAQRHWMEITYHLPLSEWYYHDLEYWGLDYPPLTAYVSWVCGWAAHTVGSIHDGAFGDADMKDGVCQGDDSVCIDGMQTNNTTVRKSSRGLGVLKDLVALHSSRWGFEESGGKLYMRFTVLLFDMLVYMSAVWVLVVRLTKEDEGGGVEENTTNGPDSTISTNKKEDSIIPMSQRRRLWLLLTALSQPALILVDHGHFQYNTVSLGLALWSFHFMTMDTTTNPSKSDRSSSFVGPILGSILFSLALNFKQMELYHAPAVFAFLLGRCCRRNDETNKQSARSMETAGKFCALGITVILTFSILWLPFALYPRGGISSSSSSNTFHLEGIIQIIQRLFPFNRGIFEGKVANLWCALSVKPFSIRDRVPNELLPLAALGLTLALIVPPCWILFRVGKGDNVGSDGGSTNNGDKPPPLKSNQTQQLKYGSDIRLLLWGTTSTSLAFFLASFQVHEKGIIIALAPLSLLALDAPNFVYFFSILATWTLWPLLVIDRLGDAYVCCVVVFICINSMAKPPSSQLSSFEGADIFSDQYITKYIPTLSWIVMILLHLAEWIISPPTHLPDLFPVLWSFVGCGLLCISYLATMWAMVTQSNLKETRVGKRVKSKSSIPPISVLGVLLLFYMDASEAFVLYSPCRYNNIRITYTNELHLASGKHGMGDIITQELLERARLPLEWEIQNAREAKPVLNLSRRDPDMLSLADGAGEYMSFAEAPSVSEEDKQGADDEAWEDGHIWQETEQHLLAMGLLMNDDATGTELTPQKVLTGAPQLLRLPTPQIVEAASFLLSYQNSTALVEMDPSLLTYFADDLAYGLEEYLPNMMFMGNQTLAAQMIQTQLALSPAMAVQLVRMGVTGGLEERQVSRALGSAASASGKAVERSVGEMGRSYRELKQIKKGGRGSLG